MERWNVPFGMELNCETWPMQRFFAGIRVELNPEKCIEAVTVSFALLFPFFSQPVLPFHIEINNIYLIELFSGL